MTEMDNYKPGTFCWTELATNDRKKAAEFYGALFGWEANERPMGPDDVYVMLTKRGKTVGALYQDTKSGACGCRRAMAMSCSALRRTTSRMVSVVPRSC